MEFTSLESLGKALSPQEVAAFLRVSVATVCRVAEEFGGVRVGDECVFFENVFFDRLKNKILNTQEARAVPPPPPDAATATNDLPELEDRHGIFG